VRFGAAHRDPGLRGNVLGKMFLIFLFTAVLAAGCGRKSPPPPPVQAPLLKLRELLAEGDYKEGLRLAREISSLVPASASSEEALYLQAYVLVYGQSDFHGAKLPLKQILDFYQGGFYAANAQKLLADCEYWQGHYEKAGKEYKKLQTSYGDKGFAPYAQLQSGNCLLLDDKVGDAINAYRDLIEKYPTDQAATSAQLMIANSFLKLLNFKQAKIELRKLMALTQNRDIQQSAQKSLRQIEEEEPFNKGVGVSE